MVRAWQKHLFFFAALATLLTLSPPLEIASACVPQTCDGTCSEGEDENGEGEGEGEGEIGEGEGEGETTLLSVVAESSTTLRLTFSAPIDAASITDPGLQFTIGESAGTLGAEVDGALVTLTITGLPNGTFTLTVASSVRDLDGGSAGGSLQFSVAL